MNCHHISSHLYEWGQIIISTEMNISVYYNNRPRVCKWLWTIFHTSCISYFKIFWLSVSWVLNHISYWAMKGQRVQSQIPVGQINTFYYLCILKLTKDQTWTWRKWAGFGLSVALNWEPILYMLIWINNSPVSMVINGLTDYVSRLSRFYLKLKTISTCVFFLNSFSIVPY